MRSLVFLCMLACAGIAFSQSARRPQTDPELSTLSILAATTSGKSTPLIVKALVHSSGKDYAASCNGNICRQIPRGIYEYTIQLPVNGRVLRGRCAVSLLDEWMTLSLGATMGTAAEVDGSPLEGRVIGLPKSSEATWLKLQQVYASGSFEVPLKDDGHFVFDSVLPGKWTAMLLRGEQVLYQQVINLTQGKPDELVIDVRSTRSK